jgi:ABC-type dipeptide/oligopeptide/nickel transport system permease subunit
MAQELALGREETREGREPRAVSPSRLLWRALWRRKIARVAIIYICFFYAVGLLAPLLAPSSYREQNLNNVLKGPSLDHPFGTDNLGRDQLSRLIYAARTTLIITVISAITGGIIIGPTLGLIAGYRGGWVDSIINRVGEALASLPDLLILILLAATIRERLNTWIANYYDLPYFGELLKEGFASILILIFVLTLIGWVGSMRLIRALTLAIKNTDYVLAARAAGARTGRILVWHILPNISYIIVLGLAASFGSVALSEIGLSFLGLGVRPPTPSFGNMILEGFGSRRFEQYPHLLAFPAFFAVALLLSFNLLGDALNDVLNPRTRNQ